MTAPLTVGGISSTAGFFTSGTFSDGGFTLNVNGGIALETGLLAMSGAVVMAVPGASTVNLRLPTGQALPSVSVNIPAGSSVQMLSDVRVASLTVSGSGAWLWGFEYDLTILEALASAFANTITLGQVTQSGLIAGIVWSANGGTLTLPSGQALPRLTVDGATVLASADGNEMRLESIASLTLGDTATLTLGSPLALTTGATLVQGASSTMGDGGGVFIWRQTVDFPTPLGTTIACDVRIVQAGAVSTGIDLPAGWAFGGNLTFVTSNTLVDLPELTVDLLGPVSVAGNVEFFGASANAEIALIFAGTGARLTCDSTIGNPNPFLSVVFQAGTDSITVAADRVDFSESFATFSVLTGDLTSANFSVGSGITVSSGGTSSDTLFLELTGAGDVNGVIDLDLSNTSHTWDITKTGSADELAFATSSSARVSRIENDSTTDTQVNGVEVTLTMAADSVIQVSDAGPSTGGLRIGTDLAFTGYAQHLLRNQANNGASLELAGTLLGEDGSPADLYIQEGTVIISGTDARDGDGVQDSHTYLDGDGVIVDYRNDATLVTVIANSGNDTQLRGTGSVAGFSSSAADLVSVQPGSDTSADFGVLSISSADLRGFSTTPVELRLKIAGNTGPGSDFDRLEVGNLSVDESRTRLVMDLSDWTGGTAMVEGVITYTIDGTIIGDPTALSLDLISDGTVSVELIHNVSNQRYDLSVTVSTPQVPGVFVTPTLPVSTRRSTLWTAVCPGTEAGLANIIAQVSSRSRKDVRAFTWDSTTQTYVEFPTAPTGGFEPWHGWFIATMVPMSLDFSGIFANTPHRVPLQAGWNLVGVGPVSDGANVTQFPLSDLELRTTLDDTLTGGARNAVIGGTVANWTGTAYQNVNVFTSGRAYWVYNADPDLHQLVYVGGVLNVVDVIDVLSAAVPNTAPTPEPPAPPTLGAANADESGSCGGGSAFGFLVLLIALSGLRRQRVIRP